MEGIQNHRPTRAISVRGNPGSVQLNVTSGCSGLTHRSQSHFYPAKSAMKLQGT